MITISRYVRTVNVWAVALLAAGVVAACAPFPSSQQPVQSSNPSVTYNYRTDQELLKANQNATTYCGQYQTASRTAGLTNNPDGSVVIPSCTLSQLRLSAFNEFFTFDNTERSVCDLLLVLLVFGNHLIPALTPFSGICLELISAVKQRHSALAEKRYTREQGL